MKRIPWPLPVMLFILTVAGNSARAGRVPIENYKQIVPGPGEDMVLNGDFEEDSDNDGMPDEWGRIEHWLATTKVEVKRVKVSEDNHALRVEFLTDGGCIVNYFLAEKKRYLRPAGPMWVCHALRVKHEGHGLLYGHTIDANYASVGSTSKAHEECDWRELSGVYRYDPALHDGIAIVRIYIQYAKKGDRYWIDDYVLRAMTDEEAKRWLMETAPAEQKEWRIIPGDEAARAQGIRKRNILRDSSFESNPEYCRVRDGMKWWAVGGRLVKGDAFHGRYAMGEVARSDPYLFSDATPHTVSCHAKGAPGASLRITVCDTYSGALKVHKDFSVTDDWERFGFSFVPARHVEARQAALRVSIEGKGCLIDAVQIEEGGLADYGPPETELYLLVRRFADRSNVAFFYGGEEVPVLAAAQKAGPAEVAADVVVRDFWMKQVRRTPVKISVGTGEICAHVELRLPALPPGAYRVHLEGAGVASRSVQFGVISPDLAKGSEICGGSHCTGLEYNRHFIEALGVTGSRHHAAYTGLGTDKGPQESRETPWVRADYWEREDREIAEKARNPKLRLWGSFYYPPEPWRSELRRVAGSDEQLPEGFFTNSEEYFRAAVPRFKGAIKYWECWNEPQEFTPKQYLQMLKWFNRTIRDLDPSAVVVGFSGFLKPAFWRRWMMPLLQMGALEHCDIMSYHGYLSGWWPEEKLWGYMELGEYLEVIREHAAKAGKPDMPIWDNENMLRGTSWYDDERTRARALEETQEFMELQKDGRKPFDYRVGAAVIVHYITIGCAHGLRHRGPHCFDHDLVEKNEGRLEYDQRAFEYDYGLKPKTIAYAVVCNKMNEAKLVQEKGDGDVLVYVFDSPEGSLGVVFMRKGREAALSMDAAKGLEFRNIFDGPFAGASREGDEIILQLVGEPVYIESKMTGDALAGALAGIVVKSDQ